MSNGLVYINGPCPCRMRNVLVPAKKQKLRELFVPNPSMDPFMKSSNPVRNLYPIAWVLCVASMCLNGGTALGQFSASQQSDRVDILHDGVLVSSYLFRSGNKPVLWPLVGPDGQRMTRSYPVDATREGEDRDHPHHRGLWMTFGDVNGMDWWAEGNGRGVVAHQKIVELKESGASVELTAEHLWLTPDQGEGRAASPVLKELCRYEFRGNADVTVIDCEYVWRGVDAEKPVVFGDTKEGMFAIRVPETMRGDKPGGTIRNSVGDMGGDTWGKSSHWVDYSGPTEAGQSKTYGIAILVHPSSFRAQGLWHVRTYGLFAHNAFGIQDFLSGRTKTASGQREPPHEGGYTLPPGETLHFFYRVILHREGWSQEEGDRRMQEFAAVEPGLR
jgi:hypothetical protein